MNIPLEALFYVSFFFFALALAAAVDRAAAWAYRRWCEARRNSQ